MMCWQAYANEVSNNICHDGPRAGFNYNGPSPFYTCDYVAVVGSKCMPPKICRVTPWLQQIMLVSLASVRLAFAW